tara:strand:- start:999 stop:1253 length:255 start_codon:yes stop_codon:yes gene_type:complete
MINKSFRSQILIWVFFLIPASLVFGQQKISLSIDDGMINDRPGYNLREWNELLLNKLKQNKVQSVLFVAGHNKFEEKGEYIIKS